jgi:hypothetical protein
MSSSGGLSPIDQGRLVQSVETLAKEVSELRDEMQRVRELVAWSQGIAAACIFISGAVGVVIGPTIKAIFAKGVGIVH